MTLVLLSSQLEEAFKVQIEQVGIDDCLFESTCRGSCFSRLKIFDNEVHRVQTNTSSIIGQWRAVGLVFGD